MKNRKNFLQLAIFIIVFAITIGAIYTYIKNHSMTSMVSAPAQSDWLTYKNDMYGFEFQYPPTWKVEEKKSEPGYGSLLSVEVTNPDFHKKVYDCCYTPEEVERDGTIPTLDIEILNPDKFFNPDEEYYFGDQARTLQSALISKGYSKEDLRKTLLFIPTMGNSTEDGSFHWVDMCDKSDLLKINNEWAIKSSGCNEGVIKNTQALFLERKGYVLRVSDIASEYSHIGVFDEILKTVYFTK